MVFCYLPVTTNIKLFTGVALIVVPTETIVLIYLFSSYNIKQTISNYYRIQN